jgi:hypothetical protein
MLVIFDLPNEVRWLKDQVRERTGLPNYRDESVERTGFEPVTPTLSK